ncbi:hypothetical protein Gohar_002703 [Gossypium harknessii]|uniref:RNase H type-1 domain-containing protein n=1 Tax=Gossypium harknessii TaxID=34285 RepID=A0A7J9HLX4_9ROSI|nr:hypothetical protein [Gossypium harknessii]
MIRNIDDDILKSIIYKNKHIPTAFVVEALTYVQVVRFGAEFGFIRVEIEGDALSIIRKIQSKDEDRSEIRAYISDVKRMRMNFISCRFQHAGRRANIVAHSLATEGLNLNMVGPSVVVTVDANDRNGVTEANEAAHGLATWGRRSDSSIYWVEEVPPEIEYLISTYRNRCQRRMLRDLRGWYKTKMKVSENVEGNQFIKVYLDAGKRKSFH